MLLSYDPYVRFPSNVVTAVPTTAPSIGFPSNFGAQGFVQGMEVLLHLLSVNYRSNNPDNSNNPDSLIKIFGQCFS